MPLDTENNVRAQVICKVCRTGTLVSVSPDFVKMDTGMQLDAIASHFAVSKNGWKVTGETPHRFVVCKSCGDSIAQETAPPALPETLNHFPREGIPKCPKCVSKQLKRKFMPFSARITGHHLVWWCEDCGFRWETQTADVSAGSDRG